MKIMMVCLGNICRSVMAEGILRGKIRKKGLDWEVHSSGTGSYHIGKAPDSRAQEMMVIKGHNISDLRAQQFSKEMLDNYDLIFCMDRENYNDVLRMADEEQSSKVNLFLEVLQDSDIKEVPDPYFTNKFHLVYKLLDEATEKLIEKYS